MYKKIMFLIITLSIIINVGNSTVVMAKENIVTEIVDFPVTINYEEYNVDDYNANDMMLCEYPMVVYKNMTYIPLTYYNCILLGLEVQFDKNILSVEKRDSDVKAKLFCPEIAGLFCRIAGLFCHDSRANLSLKPVCFGIAIS